MHNTTQRRRRTRRRDRGVHSGRPSLGRGQRLHPPLGRNSGCWTTIPCAELHLPRGRNSRTDDTTQRWRQGPASPTTQPPVWTRAMQQAPPHRTHLPPRCRPGLRPARPVRGRWWHGCPTARQVSKASRARGCRRQARQVMRISLESFWLGLRQAASGRSSWRRRHWRIWQWKVLSPVLSTDRSCVVHRRQTRCRCRVRRRGSRRSRAGPSPTRRR